MHLKSNLASIRRAALAGSLVFGLGACGTGSDLPANPRDTAQVARGKQIFETNCAACHGAGAEGAPNWRQLGADGRYPPPPLNGTGHAWHHPYNALVYVIKNGSPGGQGNMPAWGGKLSDSEIADTIAWFQSLWPKEVYQAWLRIDTQSKEK